MRGLLDLASRPRANQFPVSPSFVGDADDFQIFFARWKTKPHPLPDPSIKQRPRNRRTPTHPTPVDVRLVDAHDAILRFAPGAVPHRDRRAETNLLHRSALRCA